MSRSRAGPADAGVLIEFSGVLGRSARSAAFALCQRTSRQASVFGTSLSGAAADGVAVDRRAPDGQLALVRGIKHQIQSPEPARPPPRAAALATTTPLRPHENDRDRQTKIKPTRRISPHQSHQSYVNGYPEGEIYKCISLVGRRDYVVGSVFETDYRREPYDDQMNVHKRIEDCLTERCPYIPVCGGGCAYESIIRTGEYATRFCTKSYLAEFHYKRNLLKHADLLTHMGMRPLSPTELRESIQPPSQQQAKPRAFVSLTSIMDRL